MPPLHPTQRALLERTITNAREEAESASRAALTRLAVQQDEAHAGLSVGEKALRVRLRAEERRLSSFQLLIEECAYEQWHRMLFARFLAENNLLIHPTEQVPVTLADCAELAEEEGEPDAWMVAARYAAVMLPGIFRNDDPVLQVRFAAEGRAALERLLDDLPSEVFTAEDSLGWVYQFWQARKKQEVNASGRKIGGDDIAPVTQLFTEPYMVQFLLHNSLGAWWAARHPNDPLVAELSYLRTNQDGSPAAGKFEGWPTTAAELRVLDPCCGSGHFLVAAFEILCRMRMSEEGLSAAEAANAALRDNLFGLEIDPRCTQIAAFNVALAAWKAGGWRELPIPQIACSGLKVGSRLAEWTQLAGGDRDLEATLRRLYHLFEKAPDVGSLLDPAREAREEGVLGYDWAEIAPLLEKALARENVSDPAAAIFGVAAQGAARAAHLLSRTYHLVSTNVPYLGRGKQGDVLKSFIETYHSDGRADLGTAFLDRCGRFCAGSGAVAVVTPQSWWFQTSYVRFRQRLLVGWTWRCTAPLGEEAWQSFGDRGPRAVLLICDAKRPEPRSCFASLNPAAVATIAEKVHCLRFSAPRLVRQSSQLENPDSRITVEEVESQSLLGVYARSVEGASSGDLDRFVFFCWEVDRWGNTWMPFHRGPDGTSAYSGARAIWRWENGNGPMATSSEARITGQQAWGKLGILVGLMRHLNVSLYLGVQHDKMTAAIIPFNQNDLPAIYAFCLSPEYKTSVRKMNPAVQAGTGTLVKVPFDLEYWQGVAAEQYPHGLPEPDSDDPTQWLFHCSIPRSTAPLQVAVTRLLGYRWPRQQGMTVSGAEPVADDGLETHADRDGIVCIPAVAGEPPAAERLRALLADAYGSEWSLNVQARLLAEAGFSGGLEEWLRDGFFAQHCRLFHNRPFIWQVWDGARGGFSALLNYHRLDRARMEKLIYSYLQPWINFQREADQRGEAGANARLVAALNLQDKLKAILEGEPPYDIYVRWKPLHQQAIGWEPDLNDGVRLNIRPFVEAGVLRSRFTINWNKDRGTDPTPNCSGTAERLNNLNFTRAQKEAVNRSTSRTG